MRRRVSALAVAMVLASASGAVRADPPPAAADASVEDVDREGREAFARGDFAAAARAFERAFELRPRAGTLYNVALAWDGAKDAPRAADAFEAALELGGLDGTRSRASEERLAVLRKSLASVLVRQPLGATLSVAHVSGRALPAKLHLPPGRHTLRAELGDGRSVEKEISVRAGQLLSVSIQAPPASPAPAPRPKPPPRHEPRPAPSEATSGSTPFVYVAFAGAALFTGAAVYLGLETLSKRDDYVADHPSDRERYDDVVRLRNWTNVAWGAALLSAGVGVALLATGSKSAPASARRAPAPGRGWVPAF